MAGPKHGIIGNESFGTDIPIMAVEEQDLTEERNAAKFSRTKEYTRLKAHLEGRIAYYQAYMPDGRPVVGLDTSDLAVEWKVANAIIAEFKAVIDAYEQAAEIVADAARRQNT